MESNLQLLQFIKQNSDWEQKLQEKPYCLAVSHDEALGRKLVMLKYSQAGSDFRIPLVRECRGIILDEETFEPICVPFFKFGNYGEPYCPSIDWTSCWVEEKLDGSLLKVVKLKDGLLVSTNGTIDAFKAPIAEQLGCNAKSFGELAVEALKNAMAEHCSNAAYGCSPLDWLSSLLDEGKTYMFELTSPFNKVVVTWHETQLSFLGVRDNKTLQETCFCDHVLKNVFNVPKLFLLKSIDECIEAAGQLDFNNEGYVVCDKHFNRVKVKSPTYVALHHMKNNSVLSYERGIEIVRGNELDEVLTYFPEFKAHLDEIKTKYDAYVSSLSAAAESLQEWLDENGYIRQPQLVAQNGQNRKDAALFITSHFKTPGVGFALLDKKVSTVDEWAKNVPAKSLAKALGFKD